MLKYLKTVTKTRDEHNKDKESGIVYVDTIEELDDILHKQTIDKMKAQESGEDIPLVKIRMSEKLFNMGIDNVMQILEMKSIERAMNHPDVKKYFPDKGKSKFNHTISGFSKDVTIH